MASDGAPLAGTPPPLPSTAPPDEAVPPATSANRTRLPLGSSRRLNYELRVRLWLLGLTAPAVLCVTVLVWVESRSASFTAGIATLLVIGYLLAAGAFFEQLTHPLQTLTNVVAALRDDDFSFRARGARRGDSLGDLAFEVNALASSLQTQSGGARDALTLAERVMRSMRAPVLAFSPEGTLSLLNPAGETAFGVLRSKSLGKPAHALGLESLFPLDDGAIFARPAISGVAGETRWSVRRSSFRLAGVPHTLFVLSDVDAALREEERVAWQRLIRVLSHEINNSLTPITSLASSLRGRLPATTQAADPAPLSGDTLQSLRRGLHLIEDRAFSLHRFVQAYQQLTRLPRPTLQAVSIADLVSGVVALESRLAVAVLPGPDLTLQLDPAQVEQSLINLLRNAVEAALSTGPDTTPEASVSWRVSGPEVIIRIEDNGPGVPETANLFVPFYTTKPGGSGIGLVLAQQIAQAHRGTLSLANRPNTQGCVAEMHLPLA